jgi:hypothetical protein
VPWHGPLVKLGWLSPRKWTALLIAKRPRPSLGTQAALAFAGLAGLAGLAWAFTEALDDWAPNIAVEALSIAATITIVERIIRHEARERLRPRIESAMDGLRQEFLKFVHGLAWDYAATHLHTFRSLPRDALAFLDHWLAEKDAQDACQVPVPDDKRVEISYVLYEGLEMGNALRIYRELDRDVMEPEVVRAIDDYLWHGVQNGRTLYVIAGRSSDPGKGYATAETAIVRGARAFGEVLARNDPRGLIELDDQTRTAMQEHSEYLRKRGAGFAGWRWRPRTGPR